MKAPEVCTLREWPLAGAEYAEAERNSRSIRKKPGDGGAMKCNEIRNLVKIPIDKRRLRA